VTVADTTNLGPLNAFTASATISLNTKAIVPENTDSNSWVRRRDFGGIPRANAMSFSIGSKGYVLKI
jgi:hypothetical protein